MTRPSATLSGPRRRGRHAPCSIAAARFPRGREDVGCLRGQQEWYSLCPGRGEELSSGETKTFAIPATVTKQLQISSCGAQAFVSPGLQHLKHLKFLV